MPDPFVTITVKLSNDADPQITLDWASLPSPETVAKLMAAVNEMVTVAKMLPTPSAP